MDTVITNSHKVFMTVTSNPFTGPYRSSLYTLQKRYFDTDDKEARYAIFDAAVQLLFGDLSRYCRQLVLPFVVNTWLRRTVLTKDVDQNFFDKDAIIKFIENNFEQCEEMRKFFDLDVSEGWETRLFPDVEWLQETPVDQLTVLLMSLEGHYDNFKEGRISAERFHSMAPGLFSQLSKLLPHIRAGRWT